MYIKSVHLIAPGPEWGHKKEKAIMVTGNVFVDVVLPISRFFGQCGAKLHLPGLYLYWCAMLEPRFELSLSTTIFVLRYAVSFRRVLPVGKGLDLLAWTCAWHHTCLWLGRPFLWAEFCLGPLLLTHKYTCFLLSNMHGQNSKFSASSPNSISDP
jgi:hypothetical protein